MGCNCKKKYDAAMALSEDREPVNTENILFKIARIPLQIVFGIVAFGLIIIMIVPFLLYLLFCLVTGKETFVRFTKGGIRFGKKKNADGRKP